MLCDSSDANAFVRIITQIQVGVFSVRQQQITDDFVVDLDVRHFQRYPQICALLDGLEQVLQYKDHDAWCLWSSSHRVGLSRASRTISEDACVVPFYYGRDQVGARVRVNLAGSSDLVEDPIEEVSLLFASVQHVFILDVIDSALHLDFVKHNLVNKNS